jgi:hypothetical protein
VFSINFIGDRLRRVFQAREGLSAS